jgi:hypothetical protein
MPREDEITLDLHGLDADNRIVRATVFAQKFRQLLTALNIADKLANDKPGFDYVITGLKIGSASVTVREKQRRRERPSFSSIRYFEDAASAVYNGDRALERLPVGLVQSLQKISNGVEKKFSHAEIAFADNIIRIDDFLQHQAEVAYELATLPELKRSDEYYRGIANGSFDGVLKEIDARGTMLRGKLVLSSGGIEIDCVMNKERVRQAGDSFDKRVIVEGAAHYDGVNQIPARIDVREIKIIGEAANLLRWRGAFRSPGPEETEDDDW